MAEKSSDPVAAWREMLSEWEKSVNAMANKAMGKEDFARLMGTATGASSTMQSTMGEFLQRSLATMNLPSRAELASIGERLGAIEAQLNQMAQMIRSVPGVSVQADSMAAKPARTRQPPKAKAAKEGLL